MLRFLQSRIMYFKFRDYEVSKFATYPGCMSEQQAVILLNKLTAQDGFQPVITNGIPERSPTIMPIYAQRLCLPEKGWCLMSNDISMRMFGSSDIRHPDLKGLLKTLKEGIDYNAPFSIKLDEQSTNQAPAPGNQDSNICDSYM